MTETMTETAKCPKCGCANELGAKQCARCDTHLKSDLECLRDIDASVRTIKRIAIWWCVLSIIAVVVAVLYGLTTHG